MSAPWSYVVKMHRANEPDKEWIAEGKISQAEAKQMAKQVQQPVSRMPEAISKLREEEEKAKTRNLMRRAKPIVNETMMMEEEIPERKSEMKSTVGKLTPYYQKMTNKQMSSHIKAYRNKIKKYIPYSGKKSVLIERINNFKIPATF